MSIYDGIIINPQITVLHILPEIGMVVCKSFTNSRFGYERSLKLSVSEDLCQHATMERLYMETQVG